MAKKGKKYHDIHIKPTANGHLVHVHRGGGMGMMPGGDEEQPTHFTDPQAAGAHVQQILAAHDGAPSDNDGDEGPPPPEKPGRSHLNRMKRPF